MTLPEILTYSLPMLVIGFYAWRSFQFRKVRRQLPGLLEKGAVVVDVRTPAEFAGGARKGSLNIPLNELSHGVKRLDSSRPVIVCCASGTRSAMAASILKRHGFRDVVNAGPWTNTVI